MIRLCLWLLTLCGLLSAQIVVINNTDIANTGPGKLNSNFSYLNTAKPSRFSGAGTPGLVTGSVLGDLYSDTTGTNMYQCFGAGPCSGVNSTNWVKVSGSASVWGTITGTLSSQSDLNTALNAKLAAASNLSDVANAGTARTNLGLGTAATQATSFFLQTANNLSDVVAATARTNLGLGTAAVQNVAAFLQPSNNLSDVANVATARANLGISGSVALSGFYITDGTNYYIGPYLTLATRPTGGSFSWLTTQGGATETAVTGGGLVLKTPSSSGDILRLRGLSIGGNTTLTAIISVSGAIQNFVSGGIAFYETGTNKITTFTASLSAANPLRLEVDHWTNATTFSTTAFSTDNSIINPELVYLQITYVTGSPGTVSFNISYDGVHYFSLFAENANAFFSTAPTHWGYYGNANNSGGSSDGYTTLYSFLAN